MSTLERYKKEGGFYQLLLLIENSDAEKQQKFLEMIRRESRPWAEAIEHKKFTIEKICTLPPALIAYALELLPPRIIAFALWNQPSEMRQKILFHLNSVIQKKVENTWEQEPEPRLGDILNCQIKIFQSIRQVLNDKRQFWKQIPEALRIPDRIEETLNRETLKEVFLNANPLAPQPDIKNETESQITKSSQNVETSKLLILNKQIEALMQENQNLKKEIIELKERLQQIKKLVA